ncbi:MAG: phosphatase family protein [Clostridia bacterium]|nr:phosphatase family protein [Clostridia bacterium]
MKNRRLLDSFGFAVNGLLYCLKTQRNMRIHTIAAFFIIIISLFAKLNKTDIIMLIFAISLVLICEMINTAIEKSIDLFTDKYHPLAKIAKDVAAGAVFVASFNAVAIGYLVFFNKAIATETVITKILKSELHITTITILSILILVVLIKMRLSSRNILQGGMPSGHAAVAFSLVTAVALLSENLLVSLFTLLLGILVVQSRVENKIHSIIEVVLGATLGILITLLVYNVFII